MKLGEEKGRMVLKHEGLLDRYIDEDRMDKQTD